MSARAERGFGAALRQVERGLSLPLPTRTRILGELSADLEALTERLVAEGFPALEARRRASETLVPDGPALEALTEVHAPLYERVTRSLSTSSVRRVERWTLWGATATVVLTGTLSLLRADLLTGASPFLWVVLALGAGLFAAVVAKAFQLWVKKDHRRPGRGLRAVVLLSAATIATGVAGVMTDLLLLAGRLESAPELAEKLTPLWLVRDAALLSVSIIIALSGALAWFVLHHWIALNQQAHDTLLGDPGHHPNRRIRR
jgi:hypothetical protein